VSTASPASIDPRTGAPRGTGPGLRADNRRLLLRLLVIAAGMFAFGFALVPFYEKICQATGLRSILQPDHLAAAPSRIDLARAVRVEFDTNTRGLPWSFRPLAGRIEVHPGELQQAVFEIRNNESRTLVGQAIPSYSPALAAQYFRKVECFCFSQQSLRAGETRQMPVVFMVDPDLPRDIGTITLSFTFFEVDGGRGAAVPAAGNGS